MTRPRTLASWVSLGLDGVILLLGVVVVLALVPLWLPVFLWGGWRYERRLRDARGHWSGHR